LCFRFDEADASFSNRRQFICTDLVLVPDLANEILAGVDQPLKIALDVTCNRDYILCEYNRDGDSYRSPHSNTYSPSSDDDFQYPSERTRELEIQANEIFDVYRDLYFEGGVSSVYCWDNASGVAAAILIKKNQDHTKSGQPMRGSWDALHLIEVHEKPKSAVYKLVSSVILSLETHTKYAGRVSLAGNLSRQDEKELPVEESGDHVLNFGRIIEEMEFKLRTTLETVYFGKTKDIVNELRTSISISVLKQRRDMQNQIGSRIVQST